MSASNLTEQADRLVELISSIQIDPKEYEGQEIDENLVQWYDSRFNMFVEDKMPACITQYMRRAQMENTNQLTKLVILHLGLNK